MDNNPGLITVVMDINSADWVSADALILLVAILKVKLK